MKIIEKYGIDKYALDDNVSNTKWLVYYYNPWVIKKTFFKTEMEARREFHNVPAGYPKILYHKFELYDSGGAEKAV